MLDFPIIDTHLHLWDISRLRYPWLNDIPRLNRSFFLDDYREACGGMDVAHAESNKPIEVNSSR